MPLNGEVCEFPSEPKVGAVFHLATTGLKKSGFGFDFYLLVINAYIEHHIRGH